MTTTTTVPRIVDGRWVLGPPAGEGGMSEVYKAVDGCHELGTVAIKLLPALRQEDRWAVKAFDLEVKARLAPLDHPSIVPLLEHGKDPDTGERYLIFPWAGETLTAVLARRDAVPWEEWWADYGRPVLDALAHAHRQNVAHRDVKPDNVLVGEGPPRLADFGVAKLLNNLTVGLTMTDHVSRPSRCPRSTPGCTPGRATFTRDAWAAMTCFALTGPVRVLASPTAHAGNGTKRHRAPSQPMHHAG